MNTEEKHRIMYAVAEELNVTTDRIGLRHYGGICNEILSIVHIEGKYIAVVTDDGTISVRHDPDEDWKNAEELMQTTCPIEAAHAMVLYWLDRYRLPQIKEDRLALRKPKKVKVVKKPLPRKVGKFRF